MSKIEWTEKTWNPTVGCRRVSSGCDNCYAIKEANRKKTLFAHYANVTEYDADEARVDWTGVFSVAPDSIFEKPIRTRQPTLWFVNSMSDLFGEGVTDETIKRVFDIIERTPHHTYQVLTKRPNRAVKLAAQLPWPPNLWMGVSIENNKYVGRADLLRKIPAKVRFISAEPLLGPLPDLDFIDIDWIIVGGESGNSQQLVRPMEAAWACDLRDRAVAARTAFFFKQWGNFDEVGDWHRAKHDAGRTLDGRTWDEMPRGAERPAPAPVATTLAPAPTSVVITTPAPVVAAAVATDPHRWSSIGEFMIALAHEHQAEASPPKVDEKSPRLALREPIWSTLRRLGPSPADQLRAVVLPAHGLDPANARAVNFHAWALVDLQVNGFVQSYHGKIAGKRGRTRTVKLYEAVKPRVRVRAA
ncbi:DUF5131 family protein [Sphingomonas sp. CFBP 8760]|uniref:DUF5131 family protein n=1 Tax=Sphingomonas sp. CFBP 8760 TaxID=2775282 RepID=UPI00178357D1|nr:phage Gp37/Gp68 family protein [Sphingomonas sp. CFBP 8760]MBD8549026.1 phage Gp37/Gp68 family protein [Sphingomonas sp. CFBP 8760]